MSAVNIKHKRRSIRNVILSVKSLGQTMYDQSDEASGSRAVALLHRTLGTLGDRSNTDYFGLSYAKAAFGFLLHSS